MVDSDTSLKFLSSFMAVSGEVHRTSLEHGFWQEPVSAGEKIALMHSELSEALESIRDKKQGRQESEKIAPMTELEEEMADTVIRVMDFACRYNLNLPTAILKKMEYNENRPHKHDKNF